MKLLIVDEEAEQRMPLRQIVTRVGYDVLEAASGVEALEILAGEPVDCVLLDIMMPGMDGMETMRRIKENPTTTHIPVILVTALDCNHQVLDGYIHGADHYICKPVRYAQLVTAIQLVTQGKERHG